MTIYSIHNPFQIGQSDQNNPKPGFAKDLCANIKAPSLNVLPNTYTSMLLRLPLNNVRPSVLPLQDLFLGLFLMHLVFSAGNICFNSVPPSSYSSVSLLVAFHCSCELRSSMC